MRRKISIFFAYMQIFAHFSCLCHKKVVILHPVVKSNNIKRHQTT